MRSDHSAGRSWSPVGQTPIVAGSGQRFGANVISAISNKGRLQFSVFRQRFTAAVLIDFLTRLIRQADGQKIILILDGHPVHRATKVRQWVAAHAEQIELQFLPGYSPELNPTELLTRTSRRTRSAAAAPAPRTTDRRRPFLPARQPAPSPARRPLLRRRTVRYANAA